MTSNWSCWDNNEGSQIYAPRRRYRNRPEMSTVYLQIIHEKFGRDRIRPSVWELAKNRRCILPFLSWAGAYLWYDRKDPQRYTDLERDSAVSPLQLSSVSVYAMRKKAYRGNPIEVSRDKDHRASSSLDSFFTAEQGIHQIHSEYHGNTLGNHSEYPCQTYGKHAARTP